jgi:hypothetical protein
MIKTSPTQATFGPDHAEFLNGSATFGRLSLRLTSLKAWTHGLFILDLEHMPTNECGVWPSFWTTNAGPGPKNVWPSDGPY